MNKSAEAATGPKESFAWNVFVKECSGLAIPSVDPLYAIPSKLVDLIAKKVPKLWTPQEIKLEKALARTSGGGFTNRRPFEVIGPQAYILRREFSLPALPRDEDPSTYVEYEWDLNFKRHNVRGGNDSKAAECPATESNRLRRIKSAVRDDDEMQIEFAGWLVTNPRYLKMLADVQAVAPPGLVNKQLFPFLPNYRETHGVPDGIGWKPASPDDRDFYYCYVLHCHFWCLQSFTTWDLPVSMRCDPLLCDPMYVPEQDHGFDDRITFG